MEPLNTFLVEELRATYEALQRSEERNTKLVEESIWLEARLDAEVERTENLRRWFQHFIDQNAALSRELTNLREHCARLERRIIVRDNSLSPIDYDSDTTTIGGNTTYESDEIDLWE
jgi:predicted RNase H-like nuclease (RuvC/YqgF family)